ncbi:MAG: FeoA family protein [Bacillota bacterium]|jgi:ferrous iron transport protein A
MATELLPLGFLQAGQQAVISGFQDCRNLKQRLMQMGFIQGTKVKMIKNDPGGPLIISVGDCRLAIGRGMSLKIIVKKEN